MKLKKILAGATAAIVAVSAMTLSSFATFTNAKDVKDGVVSGDHDQVVMVVVKNAAGINLVPELSKIATFDFIVETAEDFELDGLAGAMGFSQNAAWQNGQEYGPASWAKPITPVDNGNGTLTITDKVPDGITLADTDESLSVGLVKWGGIGDYLLKTIVIKDAAGAELVSIDVPAYYESKGASGFTGASAPEAPAEETDAPVAPEAGDTTTPTADKTNAETGIEGVAVMAGVAIIAVGAIMVAKKRK